MLTPILLILFFFSPGLLVLGQGVKEEQNRYLGQSPPDMDPEVFAKGIVSLTGRSEFGSVFNREGTEFYFGIDRDGKSEIWWSRLLEDGGWSEPRLLVECGDFSCNDPFLSPDEDRLYLISNRRSKNKENNSDYDIWFVQRRDKVWGKEIVNVGPPVNTPGHEYYMSFANGGAIYFSSNWDRDRNQLADFDISMSKFQDGAFQKPLLLPREINSESYDADVYVAPDESYLIFCSIREGGLGEGDLYISFMGGNGQWLPAKNMGEAINTRGHELCPFVTKDGNYFFYTSNRDIYWVDAQILDRFRE